MRNIPMDFTLYLIVSYFVKHVDGVGRQVNDGQKSKEQAEAE